MQRTIERTESYTFYSGDIPLLISIPHCGLDIPADMRENMTAEGLRRADTDWYLETLYQFIFDLPVNILLPRFSRYVIDLNRPSTDESLYPGADTTGLCPTTTFAHEPIYKQGREPREQEMAQRVEKFWQPYHRRISSLTERWKTSATRGLVFEAHSIASQVPRFFEGGLPDFNFGTNDGATCNEELSRRLRAFSVDGYTKVENGRFKGGYITRHYAEPKHGIECLQLELSQATYMDENNLAYDPARAEQVQPVLARLVNELIDYLS